MLSHLTGPLNNALFCVGPFTLGNFHARALSSISCKLVMSKKKKLKVVFNLELKDYAFKKNGSQLDLIYCLLSVKQLSEILTFVFGGDSSQS